MKQVVVDEYLNEIEVHPSDLYRHLVDVCIVSAKKLLGQQEDFVEVACPVCASSDREAAFEKHGYAYWECQSCATLYVSPRPSASLLDWYLSDSPAAAFRDGTTYRDAMEPRVKRMAVHRAEWVSELGKHVRPDRKHTLVDVETRSLYYLTELQRCQIDPITVKPLCSLPDTLTAPAKPLRTVDSLADLEGANVKLVTAFDILEHQVDPSGLVQVAREALISGGLLVITARSASGFDIQVLWEHSTVFPLEHINLVSVEGMRKLLNEAGFEILEISTPGQLDVQMIERVMHEQPEVDLPGFVRYFLKHRDHSAKHRLQRFLQENLLSSYLRVVARKLTDVQRDCWKEQAIDQS